MTLAPADDHYAEQRAAERVGVVLELQYRSEGHLLMGYCSNLSRGGLFVPTTQPLPVGTTLTLSVRLPDEEVIQVEAEVRWTRQADGNESPGMGLAFYSLDQLLGDRIDAIVQSFTPLRVVVVSDNLATRSHVAAVVRAAVNCEVEMRIVDRDLADRLGGADLVVIDLDRSREEGTALLEGIARRPSPAPWLLLTDGPLTPIHRKARKLGRLVRTPIDNAELRYAVLKTLAHVRASLRHG